MEPATKKQNASKSTSEDIISRMPEDVITNIMDRLPIQYAIRTCILSRNWRFKWTLLNEVVFDEEFYEYLKGLGAENWYNENNISRILLHIKGSITKFDLYVPYGKVLDVTEIDNWVMLLSKKGIKEFRLANVHVEPLMVSSNLFSCVKLEHLALFNCSFYHTPTFCGFPYLLHLSFYDVNFVSWNFGEVIAQCPLLEFLDFGYSDGIRIGLIKMVEIAKLKSLKCLYLELCKLDITAFTSSLVFHLVSHFKKLQKLSLDLRKCKFIRESGGTENWVCTSLSCLRILTLRSLDFGSDIMLSFAIDMIWCLPELRTLVIKASYKDAVQQPAFSALNHISMGQLKLRFMVFKSFRGSENELWLMKNLLACSPALNKIFIHPSLLLRHCSDDEKLMFATKVLKLHRASSAAEVEFLWPKVNINRS